MNNISTDEINKELIALTHHLLSESGSPFKREIKMDLSLQRHLGIDSLGRSELFQRVEKTFDVSVPDKLLASAETLQDIADFLAEATPGIKSSYQVNIVKQPEKFIDVDTDTAVSLTDVIQIFGAAAKDKTHIYFQNETGQEEIITYGDMLNNSLLAAASLRELGLREGETVAIMLPTTPTFFYVFLGTMLAGGVPVPIYPPYRLHMLEAYAKTEAHILKNAQVRILVTFNEAEKLSLLLQTFVPSLKHVINANNLLGKEKLKKIFNAKADNFAFIQYTSGSTSNPKGVLLTHANLLANIRTYGKAIQVKPDDVAVSWLPLYHDLGLIGMWLGSLFHGVPLVLLTPFTFLNHPDRWLWAIHYHRGTLSGAPNFAYELCIKKIEPAQLEGLDLSTWRLAANGAEKVYPRTLEEFSKKFSKYGFRHSALMPVYGLAESTVGLAVPPPGRDYKIDYVDRKQFEELKRAEPIEDHAAALEFVSCGKPLEGHEIRIVDDSGNVLPERSIGGLQFRGPSSMQGYYNNPKATAEIYHDGWLDSGDLAYLADEEVYIAGRRKDLIIKAGRNIYPAEIEEMVGNVAGVRLGCVAAFAVTNTTTGTEDLVVVAETREQNKEKTEAIIADIKDIIATNLDIVPDDIVLVKPHTVPKTSSGKLQRAACKIMYQDQILHKRQSPPWMQIFRLAFFGGTQKVAAAVSTLGRFIYTVYVCGLMLLTFFPMYLLVRIGPQESAEKICKRWARFIMFASFCPIEVVNAHKLQSVSPVIFASNHTSYVDALVTLSIAPPKTHFVAKKELFSMPLIQTIVKKLNYHPVDRVDMSKGIEDAKQLVTSLSKGENIYIFPEGTFSYASGLRPFRLGAFKMAVETGVAVCPVALSGTRAIFREGERLFRPRRVTVTVCDPITPAGKEWADVIQLRDKTRAQIAKYCGEPTLDFIAAQSVAPKFREYQL